jgi:hypothetical protein
MKFVVEWSGGGENLRIQNKTDLAAFLVIKSKRGHLETFMQRDMWYNIIVVLDNNTSDYSIHCNSVIIEFSASRTAIKIGR